MTAIAIVGEDTAHAVLCGVLLRNVLQEAAPAQDPEFLGTQDLSDVVEGLRYSKSSDVVLPRIAGRMMKLRGFIDGEALKPEAQVWRQRLTGVLAQWPHAAVIVAKDTDGELKRLAGLQQVVAFLERLDPSRIIVVAAPHQDAECWLVAGIDPNGDDHDRTARQAIKDVCGFDPLTHPDRLTAHPNDAPTDAKRVLRRLLGLDPRSAPLDRSELGSRVDALLGDLSRLRRPGLKETGLAGFLQSLLDRVVAR